MDALRRIFRRPSGRIEVPGIIDHVPVAAGTSDWREERLKQAQERYGRPFKCAGAELHREILVKLRPAADIALERIDDLVDDAPASRPKPRSRRPSAFRFGGR